MAIHEVTDTEVLQSCAKCNAENRIALSGVDVGVARDDQSDARIVLLPACPTCRATECLIRSPDDEPAYPAPGTFGHLHRMLVDHLHAELVKKNKVIPALRDNRGRADQALARPVAQVTKDKWFPRGMKIDTPAREPPPAPNGGTP